MEDVHAYRAAIDPRCRIGVCSINNCLYPYCIPQGDFSGKEAVVDHYVKANEAVEARIFNGIDLVAGTGIINGPVHYSFQKEGSHKWEHLGEKYGIKSVGLEEPFQDGYAGFDADLVIVDDIIPGDDDPLAQERRARRRADFLDSVSTAALLNFRR